ncbi:hypothetical protein PRIPAC_78985 [Pristionchus pacificus]|uniref:Uncharacterized protein n=1 Tax=Pristionchus pacificus TaxID=54126 RepID=A0A454XJQ3_PRIPA|nr:hypothetical protein PRIPAC_78985 [Pristionchus pacificus]|eukprot:PDM79451.1 hypothetical protein PRIPAC_32030 [Pristionchus pacificus]
MKLLMKRSQEAYCDAEWVSHISLIHQEVLELEGDGNINNVRYSVEHIDVFKKPASMDALTEDVYGSTLGDLMLEEGKQYLLCGKYFDGKLSCTSYGQVKPEGIDGLVAEWNQIPAEFIEEMKTYEP